MCFNPSLFNRKAKVTPVLSTKVPDPAAPTSTHSESTPAASPKKNVAQDGATASITPVSSPKGKDDAAVELTRQMADPVAPSTSKPPTSTPSKLLDGIDLSGIEDTTLANDFQVCHHVSLNSFFL